MNELEKIVQILESDFLLGIELIKGQNINVDEIVDRLILHNKKISLAWYDTESQYRPWYKVFRSLSLNPISYDSPCRLQFCKCRNLKELLKLIINYHLNQNNEI